ncbi:uncharacterized protein LY89DRAFT_384578 [Mollisia scopiformis]|uniref:Uncharacterized protein n=1 Tax=Mollisia scopiformis TaxID=149040 RepID=A0A194XNX2_MOLSC|nr:uncharacterized protein LY89DRAFT_384578 [Mollisia scopiformis]KUJ21794.1 hypothetical protein LY89DRAFT_384578 [Mollisia scopiformis]
MLPYEIDQDPDYVLIKRWVLEYEQDFLWNHTRQIREYRRSDLIRPMESRPGILSHRQRHYDEPQVVIERRKKHPRHSSPSPLLAWVAGTSKHSKKKSHHLEDGLRVPGPPRQGAEDIIEPNEAVKAEKVDDLLAKWTTTVVDENQQTKKADETKADDAGEEKLGEEFLRSTRLDDYYSDDEDTESDFVTSSSVLSSRNRSWFRGGWRRFLPSMHFRRKWKKARRGSISSDSSISLVDD